MIEDIKSRKLPVMTGVVFREFRGEADYPGITSAVNASRQADGLDMVVSQAEVANTYNHLYHCDPYQDMLMVESGGELIGYTRGLWWDEPASGLIYGLLGCLKPEWRRKGIGSAMLSWMERRMRIVAAGQNAEARKIFQVWCPEPAAGTRAMLEAAGYQLVRVFHEMVHPLDGPVPELPLPEGLALRPAEPDHYRAIWAAVDEISQDHWGYSPRTETEYEAWIGSEWFQPELWQIAWDVSKDEVAGHVLTFINHAENEAFGRQRGYTETIGVRRGWRKKGLATALIMRSLKRQQELGMTESALRVDSENLSGASRLYERCGFQVVQRELVYRKPL